MTTTEAEVRELSLVAAIQEAIAQLMRDEALVAFVEWEKRSDKIPY